MNYREGISKTAEIRYVHKKQSGGSGQFADIAVKFEPAEPGTGFEFKSDIKGGVVPKEYIPGVMKASPEIGSIVWKAQNVWGDRCVGGGASDPGPYPDISPLLLACRAAAAALRMDWAQPT